MATATQTLDTTGAAENPYQQNATNTPASAPTTTSTPATESAPAPSGGSGIISGAINTAAPSSNPSSAQTYTPAQRTIDTNTDTSAGQVNSMLANDSPLLQRARTIAKQGMAQRGLVNSSMSEGAGVAAMIDKVTPLAQQDASIYNTVKSENLAAQNAANQANIGEMNKFSLQSNEQAALDKRQLIANQAELDKLGLQIKANRDTIPTSFAASMSNTVMTGVNAIMADGNLSAAAKQAAISNLTTYANAQLSWAEKFYGATIPKISTPAVA